MVKSKYCGRPLREVGEWWYINDGQFGNYVATWDGGEMRCGAGGGALRGEFARVCKMCAQKLGYIW